MGDTWYQLYNVINEQNETIAKSIDERKDKNSTDDQLFNYKHLNMEGIKWFNNVLFIIYYVLLFLVILLFVFSSKLTITNIYVKIGIILLLGVLPFIYLWIELFIWKILKYIYYVIVGYVYHDENDKGRGNLLKTQLFTS
jgi:hypothetical protein